jgi:hypothetical protein
MEFVETITVEVIATRGARLVLNRARTDGYEGFRTDFLDVVEVDADGRGVARVVFDADDIDGAFQELDARYLAGEAAAHARTWSVIAGGVLGLNRRELSPTTPDWVNIDHRRGTAFAPGDAVAYVRAGWELDQDITTYTEAVHRLNDLGAVFTTVAHGTSQVGFAAEWRTLNLMTVDGEMLNRAEVFDEADLDTAIARFEQLSRPAPRLENAASHVTERLLGCFKARDWNAFAEILAGDISTEDRRRVVSAGIRQDRDAEFKDFRSAADLGVTTATSDVVATRGQRLVLVRSRLTRGDEAPGAFHVDLLWLVETNADHRIASWVTFDPDNFHAAFEELDARYLTGEAAPYAQIWSLTLGTFAALNRQELPPTTPDWVNVDHRSVVGSKAGEVWVALRAVWDLVPEVTINI